MSGFHPSSATAAALHYEAGTISPIVFVGVLCTVLALLLFLAVAASSRFAASKVANGLVNLAWVVTIPLCLLAAFGIAVTWLNWAIALDCIPGDPEYGCPTPIEALWVTLRTVALFGLPPVIVWSTGRRLENRR